jgi:hypothetical protein
MRNFIILIMLMCGFISHSQIGVGVVIDPSLAFFKDKHSNIPVTLDWRFEADVRVFRGEYGGMVIGATFEYADLSEFEFMRYGIQGGYTFAYMPVPFTNGEKEYELTLLFGVGKIIRGTDSTHGPLSLELTTQVDYYIMEWLALSGKFTMMQRSDLGQKYDNISGSYKPWEWKPNGYLGIKFRIPVFQPIKTGN